MTSSKKETRLSDWGFIIVMVIMSCWSTYVWQNNEYMRYRDVPVTYIDRHETRSCHKGSCKDNLIGLFKTDDGVFFERYIGLYTYQQMHLGEKFELNLRQMDIKQTERDNILWLFGPILVYAVTFIMWVLFIFANILELIERNKSKKAKQNANHR
ncbi:putative NrdC.7 [Pseudomonas phage 201phi2-1]|uniref:Putative NrdC.7 n=1 Tax=Pseudomonas phage 201phi2-1 TaxID=198110 RepID=B3FJG6_BP201|nr:putative NrdC.7 [Pseudomonas phage 201phi2-1]ABY63132.1 putative NrdC.7 [Pseudomonas phage 201phi2-1]